MSSIATVKKLSEVSRPMNAKEFPREGEVVDIPLVTQVLRITPLNGRRPPNHRKGFTAKD